MWILALSLISCCEHILLLLSSLGNASAQTFRPLLHLKSRKLDGDLGLLATLLLSSPLLLC